MSDAAQGLHGRLVEAMAAVDRLPPAEVMDSIRPVGVIAVSARCPSHQAAPMFFGIGKAVPTCDFFGYQAGTKPVTSLWLSAMMNSPTQHSPT